MRGILHFFKETLGAGSKIEADIVQMPQIGVRSQLAPGSLMLGLVDQLELEEGR